MNILTCGVICLCIELRRQRIANLLGHLFRIMLIQDLCLIRGILLRRQIPCLDPLVLFFNLLVQFLTLAAPLHRLSFAGFERMRCRCPQIHRLALQIATLGSEADLFHNH